MNEPWLSIIIPTYNEAGNIRSLVNYLKQETGREAEVIVSDGQSKDNTIQHAKDCGVIALSSTEKGRAAQMNYGACQAKGEVLYFVHADCRPPLNFLTDIKEAVNHGFSFGRYQTKFDSGKSLLKINAYFTRFDWFICYGGDQTLFITKDLFNRLNGFKATMQIMEDYDIVTRAKKLAKYKIFDKPALVSARKYDTNSWLAILLANRKIVQMYKQGKSQQQMVAMYKKLLNY